MSSEMEVGILQAEYLRFLQSKADLLWVSREPKVRLRSVADGQQVGSCTANIIRTVGTEGQHSPGMERLGQTRVGVRLANPPDNAKL